MATPDLDAYKKLGTGEDVAKRLDEAEDNECFKHEFEIPTKAQLKARDITQKQGTCLHSSR